MALIPGFIELTTPERGHLVLSLAIWATVILGSAWGAVVLARRASPAVRYCLWQFALAGLLVVPLVFACLPGVPLGLSLPAPQSDEPVAVLPRAADITGSPVTTATTDPAAAHVPLFEPTAAAPSALATATSRAAAEPSPSFQAADRTPSPPAGSSASIWSASRLLWTLWAMGAALQGVWLIYATAQVRGLLRSAWRAKETRFHRVLVDLERRDGVERPVRLLVSDRVRSPLVVGALRPTILLPTECNQWSSERISMVLSHEMAHIQRRDLLWQLLSRVSAAIYWFHPLVWLAVRRMRLERERACDDRVLLAGIEPTDYATGLVACAVALRDRPLNLALGISMAQPSQLETRIRSILDSSLDRGPVSVAVRRGIVGGTAALVLALGMLRPFSPIEIKAAEAAADGAAAAVSAEAEPAPSKPAPAAGTAGKTESLRVTSTIFVNAPKAPIAESAGEVWGCAFTGDDKYLVVSGGGGWNNNEPGWAKVWDVNTGKIITSISSPRGIITASLSPDANRIAWSSWDHRVVLQEPAGRVLHSLSMKRHPRVALSPDGYLLIAADERKELLVLDGLTGRKLDGFQGEKLEAFCVRFSPDGSLVAISGGPGDSELAKGTATQVAVWDVATRRQIFKASGLPARAYFCSISPDNKTVAATSNDTVWLWDIESGTLREQIKSPQGFLHGMTYSPDGSLLATNADDGSIVLWDTKTWEAKGTLQGHTTRTRGLSFTKDSKTLASAGTDQAIRLWDVDTLTQKATLQEPAIVSNSETPRFLAVAYAPDGKTVAAAGEDGRVSVYDMATGKALQAWAAHNDAVAALAYAPDGQTLVSGGYDKVVQLWNPATGQSIRKLEGHKGWVVSLAFSPDGQTLASGSYDRSIILWNPADGTQRARLEGHAATVRSLAYSKDGGLLASGSADRKIKLWNATTGQELASLQGHEGAVRGIAFSPDAKLLASGGEDRLVKLWNVEERTLRSTLTGHEDIVSAVVFASDALVSASWDHSLRTWDSETGEGLSKLNAGNDALIALTVSPDGGQLLSASANGSFQIWQATQGGGRAESSLGPYGGPAWAAFSPDASLVAVAASGNGESSNLYLIDRAASAEKFHVDLPGMVRNLAYSPRGDALAVTLSPGSLVFLDPANGSTLTTLGQEGDEINAVAYSPDGTLLATGSSDKLVRIYDAQRRELVTTLKGHKEAVTALAFSPDQKSLLSACRDRSAIVWDLSSGERRYLLPGQLPIQSVAWSPDGQTLVTGHQRGECKLWNAANGRPLRSFKVSESAVLEVAVSPNNQQLAVACGDHLVRLWDLATDKVIVNYSGHSSAAHCARFSSDGKSLLSAGDDGWAKIWPVGLAATK